MKKLQLNNIDLKNKKVTVIGGGVIGASWAAIFLAHKMRVTICDPKDGIEKEIVSHIKKILLELSDIGFNDSNVTINNAHLYFEKDIKKAVVDADYIQENGPENKDFKINLWAEIESYAPSHACFYSSSSGLTATEQSLKLKDKSRLIIGHPFNPPHLMPLVEVVPGKVQSSDLVNHAMCFYHSLGKEPRLVKKECSGFVANRLQSAIFRECVYLVQEGIVSVDELDNIVTSSLGIRWVSGGPFLSFHLGGGEGGITHFLEHLAPGMEKLWEQQLANPVSFDNRTKEMIIEQISKTYGTEEIDTLSKKMNDKEINIIKTLK
nr:3-hydroxyacyl-CoA dehydrogenase NAD-binding domain-containing protein [uncultured Moellerella sp.]